MRINGLERTPERGREEKRRERNPELDGAAPAAPPTPTPVAVSGGDAGQVPGTRRHPLNAFRLSPRLPSPFSLPAKRQD